MNRLEEIRRQLAFDAWANREILTTLEGLPSPPFATLRTLAHVAGVLRLWLARIRDEASPLAVWPELELLEVARELASAAELWQKEAESLEEGDLDREVAYVNSLGEGWTNRVGDIVTQAILHGVHHRAQILADLRRAGHEPPYVDFIHAVRSGLLGDG